MKNWNILAILSIGILSIICVSCEKEDEVDFPVTLYGSEVVKVSNIRMFTNKEEIYDTDKIMQFAYSSNVVLPGIPDNMDIKNSLTPICFCSEDSVRFKDDPFVYDVEKNGSQFLLAKMVTQDFLRLMEREIRKNGLAVSMADLYGSGICLMVISLPGE